MMAGEKHQWRKLIRQCYGLDVRSLALLRMGLALVILTDLSWRVPNLVAHYSDKGVLPRDTLVNNLLNPAYWSMHLVSGSAWVQGLLFGVAALFALAMLVGYHTRLATIASWALVISLHHRNPVLLFATDSVLRAVMFWAMFLPLGAAYSVDRAMNPRGRDLPQQIFSGAVIAFTVQQCFIYIFSAVFKTTSDIGWPDTTAVYHSLSLDQYATPLGTWLLNLPGLLIVMAATTLVLAWIGPLLLFMPWRTATFRFVTVITFILLNLGWGFTLNLGIFPALSIVTWLAFIPSSTWEHLSKHSYGRPQTGLTIYYDADCGFCKKVVHLIRTFLLLPQTPLHTAQSDPSIQAAMEQHNSWVVLDWQGKRHFKFEAIAYVVSLSPVFGLLAPILRWLPIMAAGTRFYEAIANNRRFAGRFTRPLSFRPFTARTPLWQSAVALVLLLLTFLWNLRGLTEHWAFVEQDTSTWRSLRRVTRSPALQSTEGFIYRLRLNQGGWSFFAPTPPRDDGWHVVVGTLEDGTEVNLLQPGQPIDFEKPTLRERQQLYGNIQWRTYYINLNRDIGRTLYPDYVDYLCRRWQDQAIDGLALQQVDVFFIEERTSLSNEPTNLKRQQQTDHRCS